MIVVKLRTSYAVIITVWLHHVLNSEEGSPCTLQEREKMLSAEGDEQKALMLYSFKDRKIPESVLSSSCKKNLK